MSRRIYLLGLLGLLAACASVPDRSATVDVQTALAGRADISPDLLHLGLDDPAVNENVRTILSRPLDADDAVAVALLASPDIKAAVLSLEGDWAEVQHAGTISNPEIDFAVLFGAGPALLEFGLMQSLTSLVTQKKRLSAGERQYDVAVQQTTAQVLAHALQTRQAVANYRHARHRRSLLEDAIASARAALGLADSMVRAGNMPASDHLMYQLMLNGLESDMLTALQNENAARAHLGRLMGILTFDVDWQLADDSMIPRPLRDVADLFQRARQTRPDLAVQRAQLLALAADRDLVKAEHVLPHLAVGGAAERDDGEWKGGPTLTLELPLFDTGAADRRRFDARLRAAQMSYFATEQAALAEISTAHGAVLAQQVRLQLAEKQVNLAGQLLAQVLRKYNYMLVGSFDVLDARQRVLVAHQGLADAQGAYATAIVDLQMAVGDTTFRAAPDTGGE